MVIEDRPFCSDHNSCTNSGCTADKFQRGEQFEDVCREHYIPPCQSCPRKSQRHSSYCNLHSCRYQGCPADARPAKGRPYCEKHRCHHEGCDSLPSFSEDNGDLKIHIFCIHHECRARSCTNHTAPKKPFCAGHCCTILTCNSARDGDPRFGTLCLAHHEEKIEQKAREKAMEDLAQQQLDQEYAAQAMEEERHRQARQEAGPSRYDYVPRQDYPSNSYVYEDYDEGYRSHRNSDSHNQPRQRRQERRSRG